MKNSSAPFFVACEIVGLIALFLFQRHVSLNKVLGVTGVFVLWITARVVQTTLGSAFDSTLYAVLVARVGLLVALVCVVWSRWVDAAAEQTKILAVEVAAKPKQEHEIERRDLEQRRMLVEMCTMFDWVDPVTIEAIAEFHGVFPIDQLNNYRSLAIRRAHGQPHYDPQSVVDAWFSSQLRHIRRYRRARGRSPER